MKTNLLEPNISIIIGLCNNKNVPIIVEDKNGDILKMQSISKLQSDYAIRKNLIAEIDKLLEEFEIDTILLEKSKLLTDNMTRYPDFVIYRNIVTNYGIQVAIEDKYYETLRYLIALPHKDWMLTVLGRNARYAIDLYRDHILSRRTNLTSEERATIQENNYYETLCLAESIGYMNLMNKRYQLNI